MTFESYQSKKHKNRCLKVRGHSDTSFGMKIDQVNLDLLTNPLTEQGHSKASLVKIENQINESLLHLVYFESIKKDL